MQPTIKNIIKKIEKYLEDADDEISEQLNSFYNTILKLVTFVYKERFTSDQLESELAEIGKSWNKSTLLSHSV